MKALTLYQPWASLILDGRKTVETRSWGTRYRGMIAIHAGNTVDREACIKFGYDHKVIPRGFILCTAFIHDCVQFPSDKCVVDDYGDFSAGRFGWLLKSVKPVIPFVQVKGKMGMWNWNDGKNMTLL